MKKKIEVKLSEISHELEIAILNKTLPLGLLSGTMGLSLFFFYLYDLYGQKKDKKTANYIIDDTLDRISERENDFTYGSGLSGIGWCLEHLKANNFITFSTDNLLGELDDQIFEVMLAESERFHYDFFSGAMGCFNYLSRRRYFQKHPTHLAKFLSILQDNAITLGDKLFWPHYNNFTNTFSDEANLGISHGMVSIPLLLNKVSVLIPQSFKNLVTGPADFFDTCIQSNQDSIYPYIYPSPNHTSRLAWCYGDLGMLILYQALSRNHRQTKYLSRVNAILSKSVDRRDLITTQVKDASICHGSAGVYQIFKSLLHQNPSSNVKSAANFWLEKTLEMTNHVDGVAGYRYWGPNNQWSNTIGLLEGVCGVGLSLISEMSKKVLNWDECLLIS